MPRPVRPDVRKSKRFHKTNSSGKNWGYYDIVVERIDYRYTTKNTVGWPAIKSQNPCDIGKSEFYIKPIRFTVEGKSTDWDVPNHYDPDISNGRVTKDSIIRDAAGKLRENITMEKVDMLTALAEMRSSVKLVTNSISEADRLIRMYGHPQEKLKRARFKALPFSKKWRRLSRKIASLQLAFSFGWKPLANDIYTLCTKIGTIGKNLQGWVKGKARDEWDETFFLEESHYSYRGGFYAAYKALVEMDNPFLATAAEVGIVNPAQTIWELVPWSFAVDWLFPVGDFLAQAQSMVGLKLVNASLTTHYSQRSQVIGKHGGLSIMEKKQLVRTLESSIPVDFPEFKNPFTSIPRALNQISLLTQLGIGKGR